MEGLNQLDSIARFAPSLTGELHIGNLASLMYILRLVKPRTLIWRIDGEPTSNGRHFRFQFAVLKILKPYIKMKLEVRLLNQTLRYFNTEVKRLVESGFLSLSDTDISRGCYTVNAGYLQRYFPNGVSWVEMDGSTIKCEVKNLAEQVMVTSRKKVLYPLASILWDLKFNVRTVVRGRDLISVTALQKVIVFCLDERFDTYHHPLLFCSGKKISKDDSEGPFRISSLIRRGFTIGSMFRWIESHSKRRSEEDLTFENVSNSDKKVDLNSLMIWLKKHQKFNSWKEDYAWFKMLRCDLNLWCSLKSNIESMFEVGRWVRSISGPVKLETFTEGEVRDFARTLRKLLWGRDKGTPTAVDAIKGIESKEISRRILDLLNGRKI